MTAAVSTPRKRKPIEVNTEAELLTVDEVAILLRKTKKAVYTMIEREQVAGVVRIGSEIRVRRDDLRRSLGLVASPGPTASRPSKG